MAFKIKAVFLKETDFVTRLIQGVVQTVLK